MKNSIGWSFVFFVLFSTSAKAQKGLENIIVEKYYISSDKDTAGSVTGGYLPIGSVTYRVFADLAPIYRLQAVYGEGTHELKIKTTTRFFNPSVNDGKTPTEVNPTKAKDNASLLDTWVSVGAASMDYQGVLKTKDDTLTSFALENELGLLKNDAKEAGIPLMKSDGMKYLRLEPAPIFFNFDKELRNFQSAYSDSVNGEISTFNGGWASLGGTVGPHPDNQILLGQFTTDGVFSFELNMMLAIPFGGSEKYVANNPLDSEIVAPFLTYSSAPTNKAPLVFLKSEGDSQKMKLGSLMQFTADVTDEDGKVTAVDFYVNNRLVSTDHSFPFTYSAKYDGTEMCVSATAIDDQNAKSRSKNLFVKALNAY